MTYTYPTLIKYLPGLMDIDIAIEGPTPEAERPDPDMPKAPDAALVDPMKHADIVADFFRAWWKSGMTERERCAVFLIHVAPYYSLKVETLDELECYLPPSKVEAHVALEAVHGARKILKWLNGERA